MMYLYCYMSKDICCVCAWSVLSDFLQSYGLYPARLLCPWASSGKNTGVNCHVSSRGFSQLRFELSSPELAGGFFSIVPPSKSQRHLFIFVYSLKKQMCALLYTKYHFKCFQIITNLIVLITLKQVLLCVLVTQLCQTLCDPMDWRLPGSSVCGILQARILEWVAIYFSRGSSQPRDRTKVSYTAGRLFTI